MLKSVFVSKLYNYCVCNLISRHEDGSCPVDGYELSITKDLFPDNYTRREIAQQTKNCPIEGCSLLLPLVEIEKHILDTHKVK